MKEGEASFTARFPAILRAAHQVLDGNPKILNDPLAIGFVEGSEESEIEANLGRYQSAPLVQARAWFAMRHRFAEDSLAQAMANGTRQYVILGAGLDTFAYRPSQASSALHIFEVDYPATQNWKKERLAALQIAIPKHVSYVPVDFERQSLAQGLAQSDFDFSSPAFFSWLGVTMYLERDAVFNTLKTILSMPPSSQVAFDFELDEAALQGQVKRSIAKASASAARRGEPWKSRFKAPDLQKTLLDMGFRDVTYFNASQAEERYFSGRKDGLSLNGAGHMMLARV